MKIRMVSENAKTHNLHVRALGSEPIPFGAEFEVSPELGAQLIAGGNFAPVVTEEHAAQPKPRKEH